MSDDTPPSVLPTVNEAVQAVPLVILVRDVLRRARQSRLAFNDAAHADQVEQSMAGAPPARLMTNEEQAEWGQNWDAAFAEELRATRPGEPFVWSAPLHVADGLVGEWGVEARSFDRSGAPTGALFVVCRDLEDASRLEHHLRAHGTAEELARLQEVAADVEDLWNDVAPTPSRHAGARTAVAGGGPGRRQVLRAPQALSEQHWIEALHQAFGDKKPLALADLVASADPGHRNHRSWRRLHALANEEVVRVGATPLRLARIVRDDGRWTDYWNAPGLARELLVAAREDTDDYLKRVRPRRTAGATAPMTPAEHAATAAEQGAVPVPAPASVPSIAEPTSARTNVSVPSRLAEVRSPETALAWAHQLNRRRVEDQLEAKTAYGRWGGEVDEVLVKKFPTLLDKVANAARRERDKKTVAAGQAVATATVVGDNHSPEELVAWASKVGSKNRVAAQAMLGRSTPEVDYALFLRLRELREQSRRVEPDGFEVKFEQKFFSLHPDGETEAAAWRSRAEADEQRAAAEMNVPDVPATPAREDYIHQDTARGERGMAAQERGAATVAATRRVVVPQQVPGPRQRR
jgi:hypothetical protein